jgi:hypothetical protein
MADIDQIPEINDQISTMQIRIDMLSTVDAGDCAEVASRKMTVLTPHHFIGEELTKPEIEVAIGFDDFSLTVGASGVEFWKMFDSHLDDVERSQLSATTNAEIDRFEADYEADGFEFNWKQDFQELPRHAVAEIRALVEAQMWRSDDLEQMLAEGLFEAVQGRLSSLRDELEELNDSLEELA